MNRPGRLLICALLLLALPGQLCLAQYYYDMEASSIADADRETLIEALDEFDLDLDSPELEDMDEGDLWNYVEGRRRESRESEHSTVQHNRSTEQRP